jgi:hypothetical protein
MALAMIRGVAILGAILYIAAVLLWRGIHLLWK